MAHTLRGTGRWKNITFEELEEFVRRAREAGVRDDEEVTALTSGSGKIKELEVELPD
ncbi:hypothetical protein ACFU51_14715 [Streptomyces sp. NPDC057430]|uniref:hypothetical protein n=1 Tax=Streptomyces sp. NPDC057430 TaxID=3346131 RepID=UPI0036ABE1C4